MTKRKSKLPTTEQARRDVAWLLRLVLACHGVLDDEDDREQVNDIAKRWAITMEGR